MKVTIAPDFEKLLTPLTELELAQLEANCQGDPDHERMPPVQIWSNQKNTIIDGHNQYRIRTRLGLKIKFAKLTFDDRAEAKRYALDVQFGRRNLDASLRAMAYAELPRQSGAGKPAANSVNLRNKELADKAGVSEKTMEFAVKVADKAAAPIAKAVKSGEIKVSDAAAIADLPKIEQVEALKAVKAGKANTLRQAVVSNEPEPAAEDSVGRQIPTKLATVFADAAEFSEQRKILAGVKSWAEKFGELPAGSYLHVQSFVAAVKGLQQQLKFEAPYAVCPYCEASKRTCEACKGRGFVTKSLYDSAPAELRV